ncbi:DUF1707 SHOCT-like domain-containing protein [Aestuariimicrobium ganziense]|uniref:DUF1707 SHOCT-like domain-containing protein n=1 Tax=Aestuariimicrobium ganziense TaxID=2773677 RepID=UPI0019456199|nr:DUF1707 domain-containing protein [Aestuariimicrobium ganziense]
MTDSPRIRAGHDDRSRVTEALAQAYAEGKLDHDEFEERSATVMGARYLDELGGVLADLGGAAPSAQLVRPAEERPVVPAAPAGSTEVGMRYDPSATPNGLSVGVFSGQDRVGRWVVGPRHTSVAVMGGVSLDLRQAVHTSNEVIVNAWAFMGGVEIIVGPDTDVVVEGFGFMGGFGWDPRGRSKTQPTNPKGPRVRVKGMAVWGGVGVVRRAIGEEDD